MKSAAKWLIVGIAVFLLFMGVLYAAVQTGPGKAFLARSLQHLLSSGEDRQVRIGLIDGHIPFHIRVENITVIDKEGPWLVMKNSSLHWDPFRIIQGDIHINEWRTEEIGLGPMPRPERETEKSGTTLPSWPLPIPPFTVEKLVIEHLRIRGETPGRDAMFSVKGSMFSSHPIRGVSGSLRIDQASPSEGFAAMTWDVSGEEPLVKIDTRIRDMDEEIVRTIFGLKETGPVDLSLTGEGPLEKWKGGLSIGSEKLGRVMSDIEIRIKDGLRVTGSGSIVPGPRVFPADLFPPVMERETRFSFDMEYDTGRELLFHHLFLENDRSSVRIKGSMDLEEETIDTRFQIGIEDLSLIQGVLAGEPRGSLDLKGVVSGSLKNPRSELSLLISNPGFEEFYAEKMEWKIQVRVSGKTPFVFHGLDMEGKGKVTGIRSGRADLHIPFGSLDALFQVNMEKGKPALIHSIRIRAKDASLLWSGAFEPESQVIDGKVSAELADLGWVSEIFGRDVDGIMHFNGDLKAGLKTGDLNTELKGEVDGFRFADFPLPFDGFDWNFTVNRIDGSPVEIKKLGVTAEGLSLDYSGTFDPDLLRVDGTADIRTQDLGRLSGLGSGITGEAFLNAGLKADLKARDLSVDLKGGVREFRSIPAALDPVLRGGADFTGRVEIQEGERVHFSAVRIDADLFQLTGEGSLDLEDKGISVRTHLSVPGFHPMSVITKKEIGGSMELDLETSGAYPNPEIAAEGSIKGMYMQGISIPRASFSVRADNLPNDPRGNLRLDLDLEDESIRAKTKFVWKKGDLILRGLTAEGPGIRVDGELAVHVESLVTRGSLKITADDLLPLSYLWGERIEGSATVDASFKKEGGGQELVLSASGKNLAGLSGRVEYLTVSSRIRDLYGDPEGQVNLEIGGLQRGALRLETGKINAEGGLKSVYCSAEARGAYRDPFHFRAAGSAQIPGEEILFRLERLEGDYRGYPLLLVQPVIVHKKQDRYRVEESYFRLAGGSLRSSGEIGTESLSMEVVLRDMPLDILDFSGVPDLKGTASTHVRIGGKPEYPEVEAAIRIRDIQSKDGRYHHLPPAHSRINISYGDNRLKGDITLEGLSEQPFKAVIHLPLSFSLVPASVSVGQKGPIQGTLSAEMDINRFPLFFEMGDQVLDGNLRMDFDIAGTLEKPEIRGDLVLKEGRYENPGAGIVVQEIRVSGSIENNRLVFQELQAKDGEKGTMQANGWLGLRPDDGFPCHLGLVLNDYALIRSDSFSVVTDANLTLSGSTREAVLSGRVHVTSAELRIPDRLPTEIYDLEVIEINAPARAVHKEEPDNREEMLKRLTLDMEIEAPGRVFVRGRGLDSEWEGGLKVSGTAADPSVRGDVAVVRGRYNFFGRIFSLSRGSVSFPGGRPPEPKFDITGEHKLPDITARIRITGSTSAPDIQVESDPFLPRDEILARLLFGRSAGDMTPFQALRLAQAVNAMRGEEGNIMSFFDQTRRLLGMDQLDIRQSEDGGRTSLSVGKYVRENVYIEVEKGLGSESGQVSVEVEVTPNITLESEAGLDSGTGVGINWKWDY